MSVRPIIPHFVLGPAPRNPPAGVSIFGNKNCTKKGIAGFRSSEKGKCWTTNELNDLVRSITPCRTIATNRLGYKKTGALRCQPYQRKTGELKNAGVIKKLISKSSLKYPTRKEALAAQRARRLRGPAPALPPYSPITHGPIFVQPLGLLPPPPLPPYNPNTSGPPMDLPPRPPGPKSLPPRPSKPKRGTPMGDIQEQKVLSKIVNGAYFKHVITKYSKKISEAVYYLGWDYVSKLLLGFFVDDFTHGKYYLEKDKAWYQNNWKNERLFEETRWFGVLQVEIENSNGYKEEPNAVDGPKAIRTPRFFFEVKNRVLKYQMDQQQRYNNLPPAPLSNQEQPGGMQYIGLSYREKLLKIASPEVVDLFLSEQLTRSQFQKIVNEDRVKKGQPPKTIPLRGG